MEIGKGKCVRKGKDVALVTIGTAGQTAVKVADRLQNEGFDVSVYDMIFVKPLDAKLLHDICSVHGQIVTIEDNALQGGFGSEVLEFVSDNGYDTKVKRFGIPDNFVLHGTQEELIKECGYDADSIYEWIKKCFYYYFPACCCSILSTRKYVRPARYRSASSSVNTRCIAFSATSLTMI